MREGGDVEDEEEDDEEKPALLALLGERLVRNLLTHATVDMWVEDPMAAVILISLEGVPMADGELVAVTPPVPAAVVDCEARDRQRLFTLLALSSRAE